MNSMKKSALFLCLLFSISSSAKVHREHSAHQHGAGTLGIAFENLQGKIDFKIPSDSIIGFEFTPKSEKDKKIKAAQLSLLENSIAEIVQFSKDIGCKITKEKIEAIKDEAESKELHAEHSDVVAVFSVNCLKSPLGSKIVFNFQKYFPRISDVDVQVIVGDLQKSVEAKKVATELDLSK